MDVREFYDIVKEFPWKCFKNEKEKIRKSLTIIVFAWKFLSNCTMNWIEWIMLRMYLYEFLYLFSFRSIYTAIWWDECLYNIRTNNEQQSKCIFSAWRRRSSGNDVLNNIYHNCFSFITFSFQIRNQTVCIVIKKYYLVLKNWVRVEWMVCVFVKFVVIDINDMCWFWMNA